MEARVKLSILSWARVTNLSAFGGRAPANIINFEFLHS
jgi:hypothetical protein